MEEPRRRVRAQHKQRHSETTPDPAQPLFFKKDPTRHDNNTTTNNNYGDARHDGYARRVRIVRATSIICVNNNGMVYLRTQQREEKKSVDIGGGGKHKHWDKEGIGISTG
ncbi:hypothetical protein QR685DRAFT_138762 [Neurospora intermedia]|uniref:Uncharacterized protein n=1 Tax=Neurospora intermedia TaxID=5142 RepID=A0ABR3CY74_NEUIN